MNVFFLPEWYLLRIGRGRQCDSWPSCRAAGTSSAIAEHQREATRVHKEVTRHVWLFRLDTWGVCWCSLADCERNQLVYCV